MHNKSCFTQSAILNYVIVYHLKLLSILFYKNNGFFLNASIFVEFDSEQANLPTQNHQQPGMQEVYPHNRTRKYINQ